jgi:hypothetical protein
MAMKPPRGRKPIRVEKKQDRACRHLMVEIGGVFVLAECTSLAEVIRRLELWPIPHLRAKISYRDAEGHPREVVRYTGAGKKMTAYVSGLKDIKPDFTNKATLPSWKRRPDDKLEPHVKNEPHDHVLTPFEPHHHRPAPRTSSEERQDAAERIKKMRDFKL